MNLPNYFLADLPPEATLSATMIGEACRSLKRNREQYLAGRSTQRVIGLLSEVAQAWLRADYSLRKFALEQGPAATGFSQPVLVNGLDSFFRQVTEENLRALVEQDLGHPQRLDSFLTTSAEQKGGVAATALGPELLVHIASGSIPNPTLMSILLGVLTRSGQFVKCATGRAFLPRLFAHSLYDADPKLGACLEIAEWRGGDALLEAALFNEANCVTVTGSDKTLDELRKRLPPHVRLLGYGHRVSFAYIAHEVLYSGERRQVVARAASDVVAWDQLGCLSPQVIYVEHGSDVMPEQFAELLAAELERREATEPRGKLSAEAAATIVSRRSVYEVRAAHSSNTRYWCSQNSTAWTVVYEADPPFQLSCLHRFVYVKGVGNLSEALQGAESVRGKVSTVGLAAPEHRVQPIAMQLAHWGVTRICPLGQMQNPPLSWRHDGRPAVGDLVTWAEWERGME